MSQCIHGYENSWKCCPHCLTLRVKELELLLSRTVAWRADLPTQLVIDIEKALPAPASQEQLPLFPPKT